MMNLQKPEPDQRDGAARPPSRVYWRAAYEQFTPDWRFALNAWRHAPSALGSGGGGSPPQEATLGFLWRSKRCRARSEGRQQRADGSRGGNLK